MDRRDVTPSAQPSSSSEGCGAGSEPAGAEHWRDVLAQSLAEERSGTTVVTTSRETPGSAKPSPRSEDGGKDGGAPWLEGLLRALTYVAVVAGLPLVGAAVYANYQANRVLFLGLWVLLYLPLLLPLVWPQMPFGRQALVFLAFVSGIGLLSFVQPGYEAVATPVLLSLPAFATVLLGPSVGRWVLAAAIVGAGAASWLVPPGPLASATAWEDLVPFPAWWGSPAAVLLLGGGLVLAGTRLRERLASVVAEERRLTTSLTDLHARLEERGEELARRTSQGEGLGALARLASSGTGQDVVIQRALEIVSSGVPCYAAQVFLREEAGEPAGGELTQPLQLLHSVGPADVGGQVTEPEGTAADGIVAWVAERGEPCIVRDVETDQRHIPQPLLPRTRSEAAFPLKVDSRLLGVLDVHATEQAPFDDADVQFLQAAATIIAVTLDYRRPAAVPSAAVDALSRAMGRLCSAATEADVVDAIVETVAETGAGSCLVAEFVRGADAELEGLLCLRSWRRQGGGRPEPGTLLPVSTALFPVGLLEGSWVVPDVASDERLSARAKGLFARMGVQALIGFPLQGNGEPYGQVLVLYGKPGPFSDLELRLYDVLEKQAGLALDRAIRLDEAYGRVREAELSTRAAARLHESLDVRGVLSTAVADIAETLDLAALEVRLGPPPPVGNGTEDAVASVSDASRRRGE